MTFKNLVKLSALSAMGIMLGGCGFFESSDIEYIAAQEKEGGRWGLIDAEGNFLFNNEFENAPSEVTEGIFTVMEDSLISVYKADKKPVLLNNCEGLKDAGQMKEGLMPIVRPNERISVINKDGETKFDLEPYKDHEIVYCNASYKEGMLAVCNDENKWGFVDKEGKMQIDPVYDVVTSFINGRALAFEADKDDATKAKIYVINKKGEKEYTLPNGMTLAGVCEDYLAVNLNDNIRLIDWKGEEILRCSEKVKYIGDLSKDYFVFHDGENCGVMNMKGEVVVRAKYESIQIVPDKKYMFLDNTTFICRNGDLDVTDILDNKGELIKRTDVKYMRYIKDFGYIGGEEHEYYIMNADAEKLNKEALYNLWMSYERNIQSDYFDAEGVGNAFAEIFTGDTLSKDGVKLGTAAPFVKVLDSTKLYTQLPPSEYYFRWYIAQKYCYDIVGMVGFNNPYKTSSRSLNSSYMDTYVNPMANINSYGAILIINKPKHFTEVEKAFIKAMEKDGYKVDFSRDWGAILLKNNELMYAKWLTSSQLFVTVYEYDLSLKTILQEGIINNPITVN